MAIGSVAAVEVDRFDVAAGIGALGFLTTLVAGLARGVINPERHEGLEQSWRQHSVVWHARKFAQRLDDRRAGREYHGT